MRTRNATVIGAEVIVVMREEAVLNVTSLPIDLSLEEMRATLVLALDALDQKLAAQDAPVASEEPPREPDHPPVKRPRA